MDYAEVKVNLKQINKVSLSFLALINIYLTSMFLRPEFGLGEE